VDVSAPGLGDCSILADDQVVTQAIRNQDRSAAHYTLKEIIQLMSSLRAKGAQLQSAGSQDMQASGGRDHGQGGQGG
jgi:hypothetical protein